MIQTWCRVVTILVMVYLVCFTPGAHGSNETKARALQAVERAELNRLSLMRPESLQALTRDFEPASIESLTREILNSGSLFIGDREVDEMGRAGIHRLILEKLEELKPEGVSVIGTLNGLVPVPVELSKSAGLSKERSSLSFDGQTYPVSPLWPNGAMPSITPKEGLSGPLRYIGRGEWNEIEGIDLGGAIVVMDFGGARNWERAFSLGAVGVVVLADERMTRQNAERLFMNTPSPFPRFFASGAGAEAIREAAKRGVETAVLKGGSVYENRPFQSIFAHLPPSASLMKYTIGSGDLLGRIGLEFNVSAAQLQEENKLDSADPPAGTILKIPRSDKTYTIANGELLRRIATEFGVSVPDLIKLNELKNDNPEPGTELQIPHLTEPLFLLLPIDSVSVAPDEPHGAKSAANLAVTLLAMKHLATGESAVRRRGLLVGFLDAEHLGGRSSRLLAEYQLINQGRFQARYVGAETPELRLERYRAGTEWFKDGTLPDGDLAKWLVEVWISDRVENARIETAEARIQVLSKITSASSEEPNHANLQKEFAEIEARLAAIVELRDGSIMNRMLPPSERLERFAELLNEKANFLVGTELEKMLLADRIAIEFSGLADDAKRDVGNRECAKAIAALRVGQEPMFGWYLALSDGSPTLGRDESPRVRKAEQPAQKLAEKFATRFKSIAAHAAIRAGWTEEWTFLTADDRSDHLVLQQESIGFYPEFWMPMGVAVEALRTRNDVEERTDTPRDVPDAFQFGNLAVQARTATLLFGLMLESAVDMPRVASLRSPGFGRLAGRTLEFNIRSGIDAKEPVPHVTVYCPDVSSASEGNPVNTSSILGTRRGSMVLSSFNGSFRMPLESLSRVNTSGYLPDVYGYRLDPDTALFDRVVDMGLVGTKKQSPVYALLDGADTEKNLVMTSVYPLVFFPGTDPVRYLPVGGRAGGQQILVIDAVLNGEPHHYAFVAPGMNYSEVDVLSNILLMPEGRRARVLVKESNRFTLLLVGKVSDENAETRLGAGYLVGPVGDDRNLSVPFTPLAIAEQMQALAERRQKQFNTFGIFNRQIATALERSNEKITEARRAIESKEWQLGNGSAREAWGILVKSFPNILSLGRQAVFSAIILMAILVPASIFLERLVIGSRGIVARLGGAVGIFFLGVLFLRFFHPAFKISVSPFIVIISFVMILMSVIVLALSYGRFDVLMRRARKAGGEVEDETISLGSSLQTALSLGLSNLKKRPSRTALTTVTVSALTFSIIAFVSVSGGESLYKKTLELDVDVEGTVVDPQPPNYAGLLFRNYFWSGLSETFVSDLRSEFGSVHPTVVRGFYLEQEGGNNSNREGINEMEIRYGEKSSIVTGIMTFEPAERDFSALQRAVSGEQWFRAAEAGREEDLFTTILPDTVAKDLGITKDMLVDSEGNRLENAPLVTMNQREWRVIGILNSKEADRMRDINGKSLAMVDFLKSAYTPSAADPAARLETEPTGYHLSWGRLALVPEAARTYVNGKLRNLAIKVPPDKLDVIYNDIALRLDRAFYGVKEGEISLLSNRAGTDVGGIAKVILPVLLCILIVANTMLGTVEERKGEVAMLGAIGLSPSQIAFLLLSESAVFSILGILFGVFGGFLFSNLVPWFYSTFGLFGGLSFNFTSLLSIALAMGAGVVVLLATLFPAMRAAALAAPSGMAKWKLPPANNEGEIDFRLPFTLTGSNAIGVFAFLRKFLANHAESTSSDFSCRSIQADLQKGDSPKLGLSSDMWLAPYDLDVSQKMRLSFVPTETRGVFGVDLTLRRTSGSEEAWMRTNYGFLDKLRLQFLLWRNLDSESRERYVREAREHLKTREGGEK